VTTKESASLPGVPLSDLATTLVHSTLDLALQATRSLAERTDALARLAADAADLSRVAPELASVAASSVMMLGDRAREIAAVLAGVHTLTTQSERLMEFLAGDATVLDRVPTLEELVADLEAIAENSVNAGEKLRIAIDDLDEGLRCAWSVIEPMVNLMHQVNSIPQY
jgi:uncharacterized cupin superfamily protein